MTIRGMAVIRKDIQGKLYKGKEWIGMKCLKLLVLIKLIEGKKGWEIGLLCENCLRLVV